MEMSCRRITTCYKMRNPTDRRIEPMFPASDAVQRQLRKAHIIGHWVTTSIASNIEKVIEGTKPTAVESIHTLVWKKRKNAIAMPHAQ